jgi:hypothetical protein
MDVRVMTFNLRRNNESDGEYAWPRRFAAVTNVISEHAPDTRR